MAKLHDAGLVHGDLTTSNMVVRTVGNNELVRWGVGGNNELVRWGDGCTGGAILHARLACWVQGLYFAALDKQGVS